MPAHPIGFVLGYDCLSNSRPSGRCRSRSNHELTVGQLLLVDDQMAKTPRPKVQRLQFELQHV